MGIKYRRAFDCNGRFLVPRQVCNRWLVQPSTSVNVNSVDYVVNSFASISSRMRRFELSCRSEEKTPFWRERQTSEE